MFVSPFHCTSSSSSFFVLPTKAFLRALSVSVSRAHILWLLTTSGVLNHPPSHHSSSPSRDPNLTRSHTARKQPLHRKLNFLRPVSSRHPEREGTDSYIYIERKEDSTDSSTSRGEFVQPAKTHGNPAKDGFNKTPPTTVPGAGDTDSQPLQSRLVAGGRLECPGRPPRCRCVPLAIPTQDPAHVHHLADHLSAAGDVGHGLYLPPAAFDAGWEIPSAHLEAVRAVRDD